MIQPAARQAQAGDDVLRFERRQFDQHLLLRQAASEEVENVHYPNAHAPNARAPAALARVDGDSFG